MDDQTDLQLLRAYSETRSDEAFATLVRRHIDLVHSAAMRMACDSHLAQDVTQNTFVALAKNAPDLMMRPVITGWLHRTAQNIAAQTIRTDVRRRNREQEATAMNTLLSDPPDASWQEIAPHLDAALGQLDDVDRDAVLLRYFEKKSAREMATQLGISDDAAQKRVSRAVERLREFFAKRGITVGASGLVIVISANAVQAAPVGLAVTISTAAALTGTTLATPATITTAKAIAMTTLQKTIVTTTVAVLAGAGIYEARQASQLRNQVQMLQEQQAPLTEQIAQLQHERDDATNRLAGSTEELANAKRNNLDLLKLRGEVGLLRRQTNQLGGLLKEAARKPPETATEASENELVTRAQYEFAGFAEPKSTVNSMYWAINQGNIQTVLASMSPALRSQTREQWKGIPDDKLKAGLLNDGDNRNVTGFRITNKLVVSDNEVVLTIFQEGRNREKKMRFVRVEDEWKYAGTPGM